MGYRSELVIGITARARLKAMLGNGLPKELLDADSTLIIEKEGVENLYLFYMDQRKWYASYHGVQECMSFLEEIAEEDYVFVCIGEEPDDVTIAGNPDRFDVAVRTENWIESPFD